MGEQKQEEKKMASTKIELTDELKRMPIENLEPHGFSPYYIPTLKKLGINTLGDLLAYNTDGLYIAMKTKDGFSSYYLNLRNAVMYMGLLFNDDHLYYEEAGISDEIALIPIAHLELSKRVKTALRRAGISFFGDLLTRDYNDLIRVRNLGDDGMIELKNYLHSLGYSLKNEKTIFKEISEDYKSKGIPMVRESLDLDGKIAGVLYRNKIYTLEDLINFGERVFELVGMGDFKAKRLKDAMEAHNVHFGTIVVTPKESPAAIRPSETTVQKLEAENAAIEERIKKKEELVSKYEELISERKQLLAREKMLDEEIAKKIDLLQSISTTPEKEEGSSYGRR